MSNCTKRVCKRIFKNCETYFPSAAAAKQHRKGDGYTGFVDFVDGNVSENKEGLQRNEVKNSASNTAPIRNKFEILAQMSFIDDDNCDYDKDRNNE